LRRPGSEKDRAFLFAFNHEQADRGGSRMPIFMLGLGIVLMVMIVAIGLLVAKDVKELIDLGSDPNNPINGPRGV
jgi:hypothetical protein